MTDLEESANALNPDDFRPPDFKKIAEDARSRLDNIPEAEWDEIMQKAGECWIANRNRQQASRVLLQLMGLVGKFL